MTTENDFKILSERDHIRKRANMYIGSTSHETIKGIIDFKLQEKTIIPALVKIIEEIYQNSVDEAIRTNFKFANEIRVNIEDDFVDGWIVRVQDNGRGIPIQQIDGKYQAELAWTRARAGSNFNDDNRTTIGMNGVGSFATNCFSRHFLGESGDGKQLVKVLCHNGALDIRTSVHQSSFRGTKIVFSPELELFNVDLIEQDIIDVIKDRLVNLAICYPKINFFFNDEKLEVKLKNGLFLHYIHDKNYDIGINNTDDEFCHVSYFNGISIKNGGHHIDYFTQGLANELIPMIKRKWKIDVSHNQIKQHLLIGFWVRDFPNLKFDSQSKERVTNTNGEIKEHLNIDFKKLATKIIAIDEIIKPIIDAILRKKELQDKKEMAMALKKTAKKKIANHIVANSKKTDDKILFICEGLSALSMLINTRNPDKHGGYALRGKVLNTHDMSMTEIVKNKELSELISIIGLDDETLNYGNIGILTDMDVDGNSIFCLLLKFFSRWEHLFTENRIKRVLTPLYVCKKGNEKLYFYTQDEYEQANLKGYQVDYIKGLGSLDADDYAETIIKNPRMVNVVLDSKEKLNMAFGNDRMARKDWLMGENNAN